MNNSLKSRIISVLNNNKSKTDNIMPLDRPDEEGTTSGSTEGSSQLKYTYDPIVYLNNMTAQKEDKKYFDAQNTKILGMPHQFLETTDMRIDENNNFGYCFAKDIYMERPIVTLLPGTTNYLPDFTDDEKKYFGAYLSKADGEDKSALEALISGHDEMRYYDFKSTYSKYIMYVNLMCRVCAQCIGIGNKLGPDGKTKYCHYDWANYHSFVNYKSPVSDGGNIFKAAVDYVENLVDDFTSGQRCYVNFYMDPSTTVSENIGNSTQKSQLEGAFDSVEGIVKEANMILNSMSSAGSAIGDFVTNAGEAILGLADTVTLGLFKNMLGLAEKEVLHGANLIYPEIWMDSEYSKSYSVVMNFISPYGDDEAVYLNVLVPMLHALCLALPRQSSANSFSSPFIIRGYSKGWFSIDMGMVESITIEKGPEQSWNVRGLPTQCKVTLNIKDLYSQLMMSPSNKPFLFMSNQGLIDYLGCMCGVDMTVPNITLKINLVKALLLNSVGDIVDNSYRNLTENLRNKLGHLAKW